MSELRIFAVKFKELQRVLALTEENSMTKLTVAVSITTAQRVTEHKGLALQAQFQNQSDSRYFQTY